MAERNLKMIDYDLISVINHGIAVSNLAYQVGETIGLPQDQCYELALAGVLHDIGKALQYEARIPHELAGVDIAEQILADLPAEAAYTTDEKRMILTARKGHRRLREDPEPLEKLLYESDKASRMCFACPAEAQCDWSREKKNMEIKV